MSGIGPGTRTRGVGARVVRGIAIAIKGLDLRRRMVGSVSAVDIGERRCTAELVTGEVRERAAVADEFAFGTLRPIAVKGKSEPPPVDAATRTGGRMPSEQEAARTEPRAPVTAGAARS